MNTDGPRYRESTGTDHATYHCSMGVFDIYTQVFHGRVYTHLVWGDDNTVDDWSYFNGSEWCVDYDLAPTDGLAEATEFAEALYKLII